MDTPSFARSPRGFLDASARPFRRTFWLPTLLGGWLAISAQAQDTAADAVMPMITVEAESDQLVQGPFLPDVERTRINSGKKSSLIDLDAFPRITNNNYRQALALTPGLYLSEE